jgi:tRNA nucleotidyltransferase (CCA-adding enzyme)
MLLEPMKDFSVEPRLTAGEALTVAERNHEDFLGYEAEGKRQLVHRNDLEKLVSMGLESLPIEAIAVPEDSPLLQERTRLSASLDYSRRLSEFFPVYFVAALYELQSLMQRFEAKAFVVGGITRDMLLIHEKKLQVQDVDITVEGNALDLADFLTEHSRNFQVIERYPEFGTAKVQYKDSLIFDFASTRREIYAHCGALPMVVERGVPLIEDVIRRDFTVNALAFSIHELGHVLDYTNGIQDIKTRTLRVLHPVSFFEDPSRLLRALKFCARFDFTLSEETQLLIDRFLQYGASYYKGGGERIKQELKKFFIVEESPVKQAWIRFFLTSGAYRLINMECEAYKPSEELLERLCQLSDILPVIQDALSKYVDADFQFDTYLCFLCRDMCPEIFQNSSFRLGLTRNEREFVEQFRKQHEHLAQQFSQLHEFSSPAEIYDLFHGRHFITIVAAIAELGYRDPKRMRTCLEAFLKYKRKWENLKLELDGNDLIELGIPEGKEIGRILNELLHVKLTGRLPDRLDEIQYVKNLLKKAQDEGLSHDEPPVAS